MSRVFAKEFFFKASQERVWQVLTTPEMMNEWMGTVKVLELRPGGKLELEGLHPGEITAVEPPNKLSWSWDPENGAEPGEEILTLRTVDGGTMVQVTSVMHGRWATDLMYFGGSEAGWLDWMEAIGRFLETGSGGRTGGGGRLGASVGAEEMGEAHRIYIKKVAEGGAAAAAGLKVGDVLTSFNGKALDRTSAFWRIVWKLCPGDPLLVGYERGGSPMETRLVMGGATTK